MGLPPLPIPVGILASALALAAVWSAAALAWFLQSAAGLPGRVRGGGGVSVAAAAFCCAPVSRKLVSSGGAAAALALFLVGLLYAIVADAAFGVLACNAATVTLPQYLLLVQDGSAASAELGVPAAALLRIGCVLGGGSAPRGE